MNGVSGVSGVADRGFEVAPYAVVRFNLLPMTSLAGTERTPPRRHSAGSASSAIRPT